MFLFRTHASDIWHFLKIASDVSWCFFLLSVEDGHLCRMRACNEQTARLLTQQHTLDPIYQYSEVKDSSLSVVKSIIGSYVCIAKCSVIVNVMRIQCFNTFCSFLLLCTEFFVQCFA